MSCFLRSLVRMLLGAAMLVITSLTALATQPVQPVSNPCQRFAAGGVVHQPPALFSHNGVLNVRFSYQQTTDAQGRLLQVAQLITNNINTGPQGDCDPSRPIFNISLTNPDNDEPPGDDNVGNYTYLDTADQRFSGLSDMPIANTRYLYFSENQPSQFFITQVGSQPTVFDNNNPPAVTVTQGTVEKWIIQNTAQENHEFHMHQIHFKVLSQDNFEINGTQQAPGINRQYMDMVEVPFWDNVTNPNQNQAPQVELLMDFRGMDVGDFVYHCHILSHEDLGMMAIIHVQAAH